jgi:hypothetical protein
LRGKPYVITIDDDFLFKWPNYGTYLVFADPSSNDKALWAPIIEKAWAKIKSNYSRANGGFVVSGITSMTGSPVFNYNTADLDTSGNLSTA